MVALPAVEVSKNSITPNEKLGDVRAARSGAIAKDHAAKILYVCAAAVELFENCIEP